MSNFSKNEKVIHLLDKNHGVYATILDENYNNDGGQLTLFPMLRIKLCESGIIKVVSEDSVMKIPAGVTYIDLNCLSCTCGVKFIRDGGKHSDWCAVSKK